MNNRSTLLRKIEELTGERISSVAELKQIFPALREQALGSIEALEDLVEQIESGRVTTADLRATAPPKKHPRNKLKKSTLTVREMRLLQEQGKSLSEIGKAAGISKQAVSQHLNNG